MPRYLCHYKRCTTSSSCWSSSTPASLSQYALLSTPTSSELGQTCPTTPPTPVILLVQYTLSFTRVGIHLPPWENPTLHLTQKIVNSKEQMTSAPRRPIHFQKADALETRVGPDWVPSPTPRDFVCEGSTLQVRAVTIHANARLRTTEQYVCTRARARA